MSEWILFKAYHDGENMSYDHEAFPDHRVLQIWDSYRDQSLYEDIGLSKEWGRKIYEARQAGIFNEKPGDVEFPAYEDSSELAMDGVAEGWSLYAITIWDRNKFKESFRQFVVKATELKSTAHGDDSYFDYYPDLWYIADQIAKFLGGEALDWVTAGKKEVYDDGFYHDEDAISHGYELDSSPTGITGGIG